MKKSDIEDMMHSLADIRSFAEKQDYNTSVFLNKHLIKVFPLLEEELNRMSCENIDINCPLFKLVRLSSSIANELGVNKFMEELVDELNIQIQHLAAQEYKILDYNIVIPSPTNDFAPYGYIKYTN